MTYIGVDLDGTLADHQFVWPDIGRPVPAVVARVRALLAGGQQVRVVTARAQTKGCGNYQPTRPPEMDWDQVNRIWAWCEEHLGQRIPVQFWKDYEMLELWDDRAVAVERDTGRLPGTAALARRRLRPGVNERKGGHMHAAKKVTFTGDGGAEQFALVLEGNPDEPGALKLLVWEGTSGWSEKSSVPHGAAGEGYTWH